MNRDAWQVTQFGWSNDLMSRLLENQGWRQFFVCQWLTGGDEHRPLQISFMCSRSSPIQRELLMAWLSLWKIYICEMTLQFHEYPRLCWSAVCAGVGLRQVGWLLLREDYFSVFAKGDACLQEEHSFRLLTEERQSLVEFA